RSERDGWRQGKSPTCATCQVIARRKAKVLPTGLPAVALVHRKVRNWRRRWIRIRVLREYIRQAGGHRKTIGESVLRFQVQRHVEAATAWHEKTVGAAMTCIVDSLVDEADGSHSARQHPSLGFRVIRG